MNNAENPIVTKNSRNNNTLRRMVGIGAGTVGLLSLIACNPLPTSSQSSETQRLSQLKDQKTICVMDQVEKETTKDIRKLGAPERLSRLQKKELEDLQDSLKELLKNRNKLIQDLGERPDCTRIDFPKPAKLPEKNN